MWRTQTMVINVLLDQSLPRLVRDIVRELLRGESDIEISEGTLGVAELLGGIGRQQADVVIVGCEGRAIDEADPAPLERLRRARVIAVAASDCTATLYRLAPLERRLGSLSIDGLSVAVRDAVLAPEPPRDGSPEPNGWTPGEPSRREGGRDG